MKKITFIFFIGLSSFLYSQNKLEYSVEQYFNGNDWIDSTIKYYTYDVNGNLLSEESKIVDTEGNLSNNNKINYTYNTNNNVTEKFYQEWNGTSYENDYRTVYTYNTNNNLTSIVDYEYESNIWNQVYEVTLNYENNILTSFTSTETYEGEDEIEKGELTYNNNGNLESSTASELIDNMFVNSNRNFFTYNSNNQLTISQGQDYSNNTWVDSYSSTYNYDTNGNLTSYTDTYTDDSETYTYTTNYTFNTDYLMSDYYHPFKDKTGVDFLFNPSSYINRLESESYDNYRALYFYEGTYTASTKDFKISNITAYPVPANDVITVSLNNAILNFIKIYNLQGKEVLTTKNTEINIQNLAKGIYLLKATGDTGAVFTTKIVKK